jgi:hypothetical protein
MKDKLDQLSKERSDFYGDPEVSHRAIGWAWRAILQNHFQHMHIPEWPARITALMMSCFKEVRAARPKYRADSYDDAHVYLRYTEDWHKRGDDPPGDTVGLQVAQPGVFEPSRRYEDKIVPTSVGNLNLKDIRYRVLQETDRIITEKKLDHTNHKFLTILNEEVGEVSRAILELDRGEKTQTPIIAELIQVAAVAEVMAAVISARVK